MIKFKALYDRSTGTFNYYEYLDLDLGNYRLFLIDINESSLRANGFVVHGDNVVYFVTDIWCNDGVEYLDWTDRCNDKIIEFKANMVVTHNHP